MIGKQRRGRTIKSFVVTIATVLALASCADQSHTAQASPVPNTSATPEVTIVAVPKPATQYKTFLPPRVDCNLEKCIALTFDDGPGGGTGQVLDNLRDHGAKATFFVLGSLAEANPDVIRRMVAEGHQLANHSWGHRDLQGLGPAGAAEDVHRTNARLTEIAGVPITVMRPPYGSTNQGIIDSVGMPQMIWSVDPSDWKFRDSGYVSSYVVNNTTRGDIILLHDIHWSTVSAVPAILDGLLAQGYQFVTIDELYGHRPLEVRKHYSQYR